MAPLSEKIFNEIKAMLIEHDAILGLPLCSKCFFVTVRGPRNIPQPDGGLDTI
ncbi:MAG TPA: hypothetical protein VN967_10225 [Burkholderiales bacterium]|nr:hypothetical protein [Burkholderiales bacterium]